MPIQLTVEQYTEIRNNAQWVIAVHSGASGMTDEAKLAIRDAMYDLVEYIDVVLDGDLNVLLLTGATDVGAMTHIGNAYVERGCTFPLIGVTQKNYDKGEYPNVINAGHPFYVLYGENWGEESPLLIGYDEFADLKEVDSALIINGGGIVAAEFKKYLEGGIGSVVIADHTGRFADDLSLQNEIANEVVEAKGHRATIEHCDIFNDREWMTYLG